MSSPFVAEIRIFACNFAPTGWAFCNGQLLPISQNTALFSLLGTTYGGDGQATFALPNLQGAAPLMPGQGNGLSLRDLGEMGGTTTVTLLTTEIPAHTHTVNASTTGGTQIDPSNQVWAVAGVARGTRMYTATANATNMNPASLTMSGSGMPHNNLMPYLTLNFCIALQGVFPPRG